MSRPIAQFPNPPLLVAIAGAACALGALGALARP